MNSLKYLLSLLFVLSLASKTLAQLEIQVDVMPPYPVKLSDYTDIESNVFVTIRNNTSNTYEILLFGTLTHLERSDIRIETKTAGFTGSPIIIDPGADRQLMGADLSDLFNPNNLILDGLTFDQINNNQALPPGNYQLCLRAFNYNNRAEALSPPPDLFSGCTEVPNNYVEPPSYLFPSCDMDIPVTDGAIMFSWVQNPGIGRLSNIEYRIRMVEVIPRNRDANAAFQVAVEPYLLDTGGIMATSFNLFVPDDVILEAGKKYAWQVIAEDPEGETQFVNDGASEVCWFQYGDETALEEFEFEPIYPKEGDYLPFDFTPFIVKFTPYKEEYRVLEGDFELFKKDGGSFTRIDTKSGRNRWPRGPQLSQQTSGFPDITVEQSQHLPVYKNFSESPPTYPFERGKEMAWQFEGTLEEDDGTLNEDATGRITFTVGMSPPTPQAPANGSTQSPGNVQLRWQSANEPEKLAPPFDIAQWRGSSDDTEKNFYTASVDERWVLEVSPTDEFDSIYYKATDRITLTMNGVAEAPSIASQLYKQINKDTTFTESGIYYWRIKWLKDPENLSSEAYSTSPVWNFNIGTTPGRDTTTTETGPCLSGCDAPAITNRSPIATLSTGAILKIGMFDLEVKDISSSGGSRFTGEGEVNIPFLNFKVLVSFNNIQVNAENKIFAGTVKATEDRDFPFTTTSNGGFQALGMDESTADGLDDYLNTGERLVSLFTGARAIGLPIGIDKEIEGNQITIAVVEMEFTPERAHLNAVVNLDLDIMGDTQFLSAGIGDFCFSPNGFGREGIGFLPVDHTLDLGDGGQASLKGLSSASSLADSSSYSYFNWDCNGFKCLNLVAEYEFPRDAIVPDSPDGTPGEGNVTARMNFKACRGFNFMGALNIEPFQFPALEGYAFVVEEAWVDWSNFDNPPEFEANLPANYVNADLRSSNARLRNVWHGFWLKRLHLRIPKYVGNVERDRLTAGINNMIIDNSGFTCSFRLENLVSWKEEGNVEGWAFSLDTLYVDIVQNSFTEAGLSGKLGLPIADERQFLLYNAAVAHDTSGTGFHFNVRPEERLDFPILIAQASIEPTTVIELRLGRENYIGVDLNGSLSISSDNQPDESEGGNNALDLNMPGIRVQHLRVNSRDGFDDEDFTYSLASPQKSMSGFPISLDSLSLGLDGMNPTLTIQPRLTLAGESSGFSAAAKITINSEIYEKSNGKKSFRLTGVDLDAIHLDVTTSALSLSGYLEFYDEASANGIRGALSAKLPMDISASLKAEFGTYRSSETARFNTAQYYSYWYVEGMVVFGSGGLNLFPSLNLYGLGGGVYHHMTQSGTPQVNQVMSGGSGKDSSTPSTSGATYTPSFDSMLGLKFMALFGDPNQGKAYNFDVTLEAEFSSSAGLTHMGLTGQVRVITEGISSTANAPVMGFVDINYHKPPGGDKTLTGSLGMTVDLYVLRGTSTLTAVPAGYTGPTNNAFVEAIFYVGPDEWYYHMGSPEPEKRAGLMIALPGTDDPLFEINSYMMIGHNIPATLPKPSEQFRQIFLGTNSEKFSANDGGKLEEIRSGSAARTDPGYANAKGFAFGASFYTSMGANPVPFYFQISMAMGFDINVTRCLECTCAETGETPGSNGWYAEGQFYAGIEGSFGIGITLFRERKFPIFEMGAGMLLKGGMPNPVYAEGKARIRYSVLGGMFKGQYNFTAQLGEKCTKLGEGPLANIEILQDLQPADKNDISVFTSCTAAFALPVDEILEIPREDDWEGTEPPLRVKPFVDTWTLKENNRTSIPCDPIIYQEENTVAELAPTIVLKGKTSYTQKIVLKAIEYYPNGTQTELDWEESLEKSFKTGEAPDTLVEENILFTYPFKNQHFFLKEETQGSKGYVQLKRADPNIFDTYGRQEFKEHDYVVRFIELGTESSTEVPLQLIGDRSTIAFDVSELNNDTHYAVQLLKIKIQQETRETGENFLIGQVENVSGLRNDALASVATVQNLDLVSALGTIKSDVLKKRTLPGPKVQSSFEHLIYHYYFKTDKQDRFEDKVKSLQLEKDHFRWGNIEGFTLTYPNTVSFDWLDGKGYRNSSGRKVFDPLVKIQIQQLGGEFASASDYPVNYYYEEKVMANIEAPRVTLSAIVNRHMLPSLPYFRQMDYKRFVHFSSDSPFLNPLTERDLNRANTPPDRQSQIRGAVSSSSERFGVGNFGFSSSSTLGNFVSSIEPATYKVTHTLSVPGVSNFIRFKSIVSGYLSRSFPTVIIGSGLQTNSNSYVNQYRDKYDGRRKANGQRISSYFMTFHPRAYGTILRSIFRADNAMLYPATSGRNKHSYISQYQYPLPGRSPRMANGSAWRHTFTHE